MTLEVVVVLKVEVVKNVDVVVVLDVVLVVRILEEVEKVGGKVEVLVDVQKLFPSPVYPSPHVHSVLKALLDRHTAPSTLHGIILQGAFYEKKTKLVKKIADKMIKDDKS